MTATIRRTLRATAIAVVIGLGLAACTQGDASGDAPQSPAAGAAAHNDADTEFAQMMIVHHEGALEMAGLAEQKASTAEVKDLASRITGAQQPEIDLMTGWLEAWGEESDPMGGMDMGGMDHGGMDMDGMDQGAAMDDLDGLGGAEFDKRFLELMTAHHQGAVTMAEAELDHGENGDAQELAQSIIDAQTTEIDEMGDLMGRVG